MGVIGDEWKYSMLLVPLLDFKRFLMLGISGLACPGTIKNDEIRRFREGMSDNRIILGSQLTLSHNIFYN
ncbi:hypothetical protein [Cohnella abietis]|uniref:hypothetical protein n=1 Tax=Cohnella abietis TaxID=2507935 RepID=UPI00102E75BC|nr:hypothetical protein [Cohnella abietis]